MRPPTSELAGGRCSSKRSASSASTSTSCVDLARRVLAAVTWMRKPTSSLRHERVGGERHVDAALEQEAADLADPLVVARAAPR